jgi:hypothetical protein
VNKKAGMDSIPAFLIGALPALGEGLVCRIRRFAGQARRRDLANDFLPELVANVLNPVLKHTCNRENYKQQHHVFDNSLTGPIGMLSHILILS